ncbi:MULTISPECIES: NAD(P)-dependent oxidoreductase [unclassified Streptomyces]|uniref:NAD-dependent epimerase/dehydratase family protein n=1 Tax=unclassified Streptomyces TaxID=2593676 RepID=UPI00278BE954|nr:MULTISPECIES: NAD-dependent epimerase/dehydratase family protein [unclassified Streptomyces]
MSAPLTTTPSARPAAHLVIGGAGFVGSHLTDALLAQGHTVVVLDDLSTGERANLAAAWPDPRLRFVRGSALDERLLDELVSRCEVVVHLAAERASPAVVEAAHRHGRRLLLVTGDAGAAEASAGACGGEAYGGACGGEAYGGAVTVARLDHTVGPRQSSAHGALLPRLAEQAVAGLPLTIHGDGNRRLRLTHVADTVDALLRLLAKADAVGGAFDVGGEWETAVADLAGVVVERSGSPSPLRFVPYEYEGEGEEVGEPVPDTRRLRELTGWRPRLGLADIVDAALVDAGGAFGVVTTAKVGA